MNKKLGTILPWLALLCGLILCLVLFLGYRNVSSQVREKETLLAESRAVWEGIAEKKEALQKDLKQVKSDLKEAKLTIEESKERQETLQTELKTLQSDIDSLTAQIETLKKEN